MASGVPERPVVLRRLGIIKNETDSELLPPLATPVATTEDSLESFGTEAAPGFFTVVTGRAAALLAATARKPWILIVGFSVILFAVAVLAINALFGPAEPPVAASAAAASESEAAATPQTSPATTVRSKPLRPATAKPAAGRTASVRRDESITPAGPSRTPAAETARRAESRSSVAPPVADEEIAPSAAAAPVAAAVVDDRIYSVEDADVIPPKTTERLPDPTFSAWTTRTNAMEVIVSDTGAVEHVRLVGAPQRMPDILVLSRAKMWKFTPALKDGRPVRYRLRLTWEVNP
jgi:hypothetical protein